MIPGSVCIGVMISLVLMAACAGATAFPPAPHAVAGQTSDDYFGTKVADPYRSLEDESLPQTQAFIEANNARTRVFLDGEEREKLKARITELLDYPRQSAPDRWGNFAFCSTNSGLQNQSVYRVTQKIPSGEWRALIDPNALSPDGSISIGDTTPSYDGTLLAYGLNRGGSDHSEVHVMDVGGGKDLSDRIGPARLYGIEWKHDNSGFYYGRFPKTTEHGKDEQAYGYQMFFHQLGTPAEKDRLVYERPDDRELTFDIGITEDGKYETMELSYPTKSENRLYWRRSGEETWNKLFDKDDFAYHPIETDGGSVLYVLTTSGSPRRKVVAIDLQHPEPHNWKTLITPEGNDVLDEVHLIGGKFVAVLVRDAHSVVRIYNLDGTLDRDVELPTIGSVDSISGRPEHSNFYYTFTSFSYPSTVFRYDLKTHETTTDFAPKVKFTPGDYETKQLFATSKDGTRVPVFVTCKKGTKLDGTNPTILGGYGGFNISITPSFSSSRIAWLERGGVFAQACMRGGGEYGDAWHQAGMLDKKQNVFDDFCAAAEMLIKEGYTSSKKLAIEGGSNGGLLVAACMLQRPELFGAVVCHVPVADMLRYQKLGIGRFWTVEFGDATHSAEEFKYLYAYSPLHKVKAGQVYPPILIMTGAGDNRVVPGHSYKFAATLQAAASADGNPVLLWTEPKAGHGHGKPTSTIINQAADGYAFLARVLGMESSAR
jgi:prolyl oligopeptidase